jgi:hypothetical protein
MQRKLTNQRKLKPNFDKGDKLEKKYKTTKSKPKFRNSALRRRIIVGLSSVIFVCACVLGYIAYIEVQTFDARLASSINQLDDTSCRKYEYKLINSLLYIQEDENGELKDALLYLYSGNSKYTLSLNNYIFDIDNLGTQGTLKDFINTNNIFLDKKSVFKYLSNFFYRKFYIKLDSVVISNNSSTLNDYYKINSVNFILKAFHNKDQLSNFSFYTDLCNDDLSSMLRVFFSPVLTNHSFDYSSDIKIKDLFDLDSIKKEQVRIQILNSSGVDNWGNFMAKIFDNYGLNIVKIDSSNEVSSETKVLIDREELKNTNTVDILEYILSNNSISDISTQESIYSDIYIILGQDSLV